MLMVLLCERLVCKKFAYIKAAGIFLSILVAANFNGAIAQPGRWQQQIKYVMQVDVDATTNRLDGTQLITYSNNSPDTLRRLFMHLYWNAFKPGSAMDAHSRSTENLVIGRGRDGKEVTDFDRRFQMRVADMKPEEEGWCRMVKITSGGVTLETKEHETILEIILARPLAPKQQVVLNTQFNCQVPKMCRRSGRDNKQGVRFSIGQWYPKMVEYDQQGWHADPYVGREYYGVWGDYDVTIRIDSSFKLGGTGVLQNATEIGWGYDREGTPLKPSKTVRRSWHFLGNNIHDFVWAADPDYLHMVRKVSNNRTLHFLYKGEEEKWKGIADSCAMALPFIEKTFGVYPYPQFSFMYAGGGGTEYPMATMMNGVSLSTAIHEWMHNWYYGILGTNENAYAWMDEGFADYADARVLAWLRQGKGFTWRAEYDRYVNFALSRFAEPLSTPANLFTTNNAYNSNAYYKGCVFLAQLGYIIGDSLLDNLLLAYYNQWRFRHPEPNDFIRVAERVSGQELHWYLDLWLNTTKTINYGIDSLWMEGAITNVRIRRLGEMPMPLDVVVNFRDSTSEMHYVPLSFMYGKKPAEDSLPRKIYEPGKWPVVDYVIQVPRRINDILSIEIDPSQRMADIDRRNNKLELKW